MPKFNEPNIHVMSQKTIVKRGTGRSDSYRYVAEDTVLQCSCGYRAHHEGLGTDFKVQKFVHDKVQAHKLAAVCEALGLSFPLTVLPTEGE